jgi:hypothetical protein
LDNGVEWPEAGIAQRPSPLCWRNAAGFDFRGQKMAQNIATQALNITRQMTAVIGECRIAVMSASVFWPA